MTTRNIQLNGDQIPYLSGYDCEEELVGEIVRLFGGNRSAIVIADTSVNPIERRISSALRDSLRQVCVLRISPSESRKSLSTVEKLIETALGGGVDRDAFVVALGGGVVGNLAGMVAGLLFRGVPLVHLPTTPVAAFDAVLSRKQAVNVGGWKNPAGLFKTPALIAVDLCWLESVPGRQMRTGLVEMAKNVLAVRPDFRTEFTHAVANLHCDPHASLKALLRLGIESKSPFLRADGDELREALIFEYGHTIGHALEAASGGRMSHGEAVGWGMFAAADLARDHAGLSDSAHAAHDELLEQLGISRERPPQLHGSQVKLLVRGDNKRGHIAVGEDRLPMVLLSRLGGPVRHLDKPLVGINLRSIDHTIDRLLCAG